MVSCMFWNVCYSLFSWLSGTYDIRLTVVLVTINMNFIDCRIFLKIWLLEHTFLGLKMEQTFDWSIHLRVEHTFQNMLDTMVGWLWRHIRQGKQFFGYVTNFDNHQSRQRQGFTWPNWHSLIRVLKDVLIHLNWHHPDLVQPGGERPTQDVEAEFEAQWNNTPLFSSKSSFSKGYSEENNTVRGISPCQNL